MQIPDYNQMVDLKLSDRGQVRLNNPEALTSTAGIQANAQQITKAAEDLSNVYLQMKQNRDEGIVNAFMNEFTVARALKLNELKKTYNGANAEGIMQAYDDWQKEYFNQRIGSSADNDNMLTLENDEQITAARKAFDNDFATSIDGLSRYAASELNSWEKEQKNERLRQLASEMKSSPDLETFNAKKKNALNTLMDKLSREEIRAQEKEERENERKRKELDKLMGKLDAEDAKEQAVSKKNIQNLMKQLDKEEAQAEKQAGKNKRALEGLLAKIDRDTEKETAALERARKKEEKQQAAIDRAYQKQIEREQNKTRKEELKAQQAMAKDLLKRINNLASNAMSAQISDDIVNDPSTALTKLNNQEVLDEIANKNTVRSLRSNAVKAFIDQEAENKSEAMLSETEYLEPDVGDFIDVLPYGYQTKIDNKAQWLYNTKKKTRNVQEDSVNTPAGASLWDASGTVNKSKSTKSEVLNANDAITKALQDLGQTERGQKTAAMLADTRLGVNQFKIDEQNYNNAMVQKDSLIANALADEAPDSSISSNILKYLNSEIADFDAEKRTVENQMPDAVRILDRIDNGEIDNYNSLDDVIGDLHPVVREKLINEFTSNAKWNIFLKQNKGKSAYIDSKVRNAFKDVSGIDSAKNPYLYKKFRNGMKDAMINYQVNNNGKLPDMNQLLDQSMEVYLNLNNDNIAGTILQDMSSRVKDIQKDLVKNSGSAPPALVKQRLREVFESDYADTMNISNENLDKIIELMLNGKIREAEFILGM